MAALSENVWRRFGVELHKFREHAGMTQGQLARAVPMSQSQVSALERGARGTTPEQIRRFDQVLNTGGALIRRWEDARNQHGYAAWSLGTVELEQTATEILKTLRCWFLDYSKPKTTHAPSFATGTGPPPMWR